MLYGKSVVSMLNKLHLIR